MEPEKCCESGCIPCERDPDGKEPIDLCNYIGGEFVCHSGNEWKNVLEPATGHRFARVPLSTPHDVDSAVKAARAAPRRERVRFGIRSNDFSNFTRASACRLS